MLAQEGTPNVAFQNEAYVQSLPKFTVEDCLLKTPYLLSIFALLLVWNRSKYPGQTTEFRGPGVSAENPAGAFPRDTRQRKSPPPLFTPSNPLFLPSISSNSLLTFDYLDDISQPIRIRSKPIDLNPPFSPPSKTLTHCRKRLTSSNQVSMK